MSRYYKKPWTIKYDPTGEKKYIVQRIKPEPFGRETKVEWARFGTYFEAKELQDAMNEAEGLA